jgi:hypothetical protein
MTTTVDEFDSALALAATGILREFNQAGVILAADVHVASRLTTMLNETDDGRRIVVSAADGLLASRTHVPDPYTPAPYRDLGQAEPGRDYSGTVFITARFRTGSTLLWNIFRHVQGCVAYYEPLNERRWFDASRRGDRIDRSHRGVDDYWREYEGLEDLGSVYRESWVDRQLVMDETTWAPELREYIDRLIGHASPARAILQFNRVDFRLPWLRRQFPGVTILHLYRHPRSQWCSSLMTPAKVPRDVAMDAFEPFDHFYLARWARDLRRHFPFIADRGATTAYRTFYLIWKLSYLCGAALSDCSLSYESLIDSPRSGIATMLDACGLQGDTDALTGLVGAASPDVWRSFASEDWFRAHESACETVLAEFMRGQDRSPSPLELASQELPSQFR